jgi:N-acetylglutamate synthase-like GNAT family acetyltransferase
MMVLEVRIAREDELAWANQRWAEIDFVTSSPGRDLIVIAELDGTPAGLGRLVRLANGEVELGGIVVFPEFRRRGVAEAIVTELVARIPAGVRAYCLPFEHLESFYARFGFARLDDRQAEHAAPEAREKLAFCRRTYPMSAVLMAR